MPVWISLFKFSVGVLAALLKARTTIAFGLLSWVISVIMMCLKTLVTRCRWTEFPTFLETVKATWLTSEFVCGNQCSTTEPLGVFLPLLRTWATSPRRRSRYLAGIIELLKPRCWSGLCGDERSRLLDLHGCASADESHAFCAYVYC